MCNIHSANIPSIYPSLGYRATEEIYRDVLTVARRHSGLITVDSMDTGLEAYGDLFTDNLKSFDMQPYHTFGLNMTMFVNYNCGFTFPSSTLQYFPYPFPIIDAWWLR